MTVLCSSIYHYVQEHAFIDTLSHRFVRSTLPLAHFQKDQGTVFLIQITFESNNQYLQYRTHLDSCGTSIKLHISELHINVSLLRFEPSYSKIIITLQIKRLYSLFVFSCRSTKYSELYKARNLHNLPSDLFICVATVNTALFGQRLPGTSSVLSSNQALLKNWCFFIQPHGCRV